MAEYQHIVHTFEPVYDNRSKILILGSLPSVKSREQGFYYGHPRNRFWKVLAFVFQKEEPQTISEKRQFLLNNKVAVWDVIQSCDIVGSSDSSIRNVEPAPIEELLRKTGINHVFANGKTAAGFYKKYIATKNMLPIQELPSTSPANAVWSLLRLQDVWAEAIGKAMDS